MNWLAFLLILSGNLMIGNKIKFGFIMIVLGSMLWAKIGFDLPDYALMAVNITGIMVMIRNWLKWRGEEKYWVEIGRNERRRSGKFFWEK